MFLIHHQCSPITAIKLYKCFKVIGLMVNSLSLFPSSVTTELGGTPVSLKQLGVLIHHSKCN